MHYIEFIFRKVLVLCLGLLVSLTGCQKDNLEDGAKLSPAFEELMKHFSNGEILVSVSRPDMNTHKLSFESGAEFVFSSTEFNVIKDTDTWPSAYTDSYGKWNVNGRKTEISVTEKATCAVAAYFDSDGAWFRLNNGEFAFFTYNEAREIGAVKIEKCNNPTIKASATAEVKGYVVRFKEKDIVPLTTTGKPTIAVRGTGLKINGLKYINGKTSIGIQEAEITWTGFDGQQKSMTFACDLTPQVPVIHISTKNGASITSTSYYVQADFRIEDPFGFYEESESATVSGEIRGRGNTTWGMPKKPYRIKFSEKVKLLGMPKSKHWVLLANYSDKTLMRNSTCMRISEELGVLVWTPRHRHAEVYLNGQYLGLYTVIESVRPANDRVPLKISGVDPDTDITGGYLLEIDDKHTCPGMFTTAHGVPIGFKDPDTPTAEQIAYIRQYIKTVEDAVYSNKDPNYYNIYSPHIDIPSFAANYIIQELVKNIDGNFRLSNFLGKYQNDDVLYMTNVWDFDLAIGNCDYFPSMYGATNTYEGFFVWGHSHWYSRLFTNYEFKQAVKEMWNTKMYPKIDKIIEDVRNDTGSMRAAIDRNFNKWEILGVYHWPNCYVNEDYDKNLDFMLQFLRQRADWLNTEINKW